MIEHMAIGRIEIDFGYDEDDDNMFEIMEGFTNYARQYFPVGRWLEISAFDDIEDEYELGFDSDEMEELEPALARALERVPEEWRENAENN